METTLVPFQALPACAANCGPLYDANGACVPPAAPTADANAYDKCLCSQPVLQPFSTGVAGVCDNACAADPAGITPIQQWYSSFCASANAVQASNGAPMTGGASPTATGLPNHGGGGDWISTHWKWVIMLVILVVGITFIWIGACIWRRRYLARRDRIIALGKGTASPESWVPPPPAPGTSGPTGGTTRVPPASEVQPQPGYGPGQFMPGGAPPAATGEGSATPRPSSAAAAAATMEQDAERRRWLVSERT